MPVARSRCAAGNENPDLPTGAVTVTSSQPLEEQSVRTAVEEAGYQLA